MAGRHAKGRGRHAAPDTRPPLLVRAILWGIALTLIVTFFPVLLGLGLALGIMFGWMGRAITRN
jgi:ABC-type sugar transport system permease subunit